MKREVCSGCLKNINIGQAIVECQKCSTAIHTKCFNKSSFTTVNNSHYCWPCHTYIPNKISPLLIAQKQCMRILFGDREAFIEKFRTCARTRVFGSQILGEAFYQKEHTKPLFKQHNVLCLQNLYTYHCFMEIFKILKLRTPISIHSTYSVSHRKSTMLITPIPSNNFMYKSAHLWNTIQPQLRLYDYSTKISLVKNTLKTLLFRNQHTHDDIEWLPCDFAVRKLPVLQ